MIPYNTDAPIYHLPVVTVGLIVLNTLLFFGLPARFVEPDDITITNNGVPLDPDGEEVAAVNPIAGLDVEVSYPGYTWVLQYGAGIKPWQWATSIFVHEDFFHLLFNMIFLWAFGLVIEGKVGALVFLLLYMGIGVSQSALEQSLMCVWGTGASLGASAAIFGLLGLAIVWAPRNEFDVLWGFGLYMTTFEIPILMFGFIKFAFEFIGVAISGAGMSSSLLHLMGFAIGIAAGFVWLRRGWVDCEGWDLISVLKGKEGRPDEDSREHDEARELVLASTKSRVKEDAEKKPRSTSSFSAENHRFNTAEDPNSFADFLDAESLPAEATTPEEDIEQLIVDEQITTAIKLTRKHQKSGTQLKFTQPVLFAVVKGFLGEQDFHAALPLMEEHAKRFRHGRVEMLLNMAKTLLHLELPRKAQRPLKTLQSLDLDDNAKTQWKALVLHSKKLIADGAVELQE